MTLKSIKVFFGFASTALLMTSLTKSCGLEKSYAISINSCVLLPSGVISNTLLCIHISSGHFIFNALHHIFQNGSCYIFSFSPITTRFCNSCFISIIAIICQSVMLSFLGYFKPHLLKFLPH